MAFLSGAAAPAGGGALAQTLPLDPGPFPPLRYLEDHRALADPAVRTGPFDPLKYVLLGRDPAIYISTGVEVRERYEAYRNEGFGLLGPRRDKYLLSRVLVHGDLHLGERVRVFVQLGRHDAVGKAKPLAPPDADRFDVQQAFADVTVPGGAGAGLTLRAGRQEILLGSGRFVDVREGPNVRQSHDGLRAFATFNGGTRLDAFLVRPTRVRPGSFDDDPDPRQTFGGLYATMPLLGGGRLALDAYYYALHTGRSRVRAGLPEDRRHTFGARLWGRAGGWDHDTDVVFQAGSVGPDAVRAGGVSSRLGYTFVGAPWQPRLGLQADYFSGGDARRGTVSTFDPLFPRGGYTSEPGLQTFANLIGAFPSITLNPLPTLAIEAGVDFTWRASTRDAVYLAPGIPVPGTAAVPGRYIGTNYVLQASWTATPNLSVNGSLVHVAAGPAVTRAGGRGIDYGAAWTAFKF